MKYYQHYDGEFGIYNRRCLQKKTVWMFMIVWYVLLVILFVIAPVQQVIQEDAKLATNSLPVATTE